MSEYEGREQSRAKHEILRGYLGRFAHIIGSWKSTITYVDCFSGPWEVQNTDLSDTSFAIAIEELRKARDTLKEQQGKNVKLRCFFLEEQRDSYKRLAAFAAAIPDIEIETKKARLDQAVADILRFVEGGGPDSFPFFLIDPTGWTGFELDVITPLLQRQPGEVLVNFMTSFIRRFIHSNDSATQASFDCTFGPFRPSRDEVDRCAPEDLDDLLVGAYSRLLKDVGKFPHVCNSIILDPDKDSTHFNLLYATRDLRGMEAFKDAERPAMKRHEDARAKLRGAKAENNRGPGLFGASSFGSRHYDNLRDCYLAKARAAVVTILNSRDATSYDAIFAAAMTYPLVWEKDLKDWIRKWRTGGYISIAGLKPKEREPKLKKGHVLKALKSILT